MVTMEGWTTIRYLHAPGKGIRAIAKELGSARKTVRHARRIEGAPRYERPTQANPKLEQFVRRSASCTSRSSWWSSIGSRRLNEADPRSSSLGCGNPNPLRRPDDPTW
jgi:IS30 family transposase